MKLRDWREKRGLNQSDLGGQLEISAASVSRIENGEYIPSGKVLVAIESATKGAVTASDILATYQERQAV